MDEEFTKYETARILGARALQVAMDAPILLKISKEELEKLKYNPLKIAELEFNADVLPITVKRPMPHKKEAKIKRTVEEKEKEEKEKEGKEKPETTEEKEVEKKEESEEKEIQEEGEIMELVKPEDEIEEEEEEAGGEEGI